MELIGTPRCGVPDVLDEQLVDDQEILDVGDEEKQEEVNGTTSYLPTRRKRYALRGSRWRTKSLTYKVTKQQKCAIREVTNAQPCVRLFSSLERLKARLQSRCQVQSQLTKALKARLQSRCQVQSQLTKALKARLQSRCEVHASHNVQKPPMTFSCHKSGRCLNHTWKTSKLPVSPWEAIQQTVHYPDTPFPLVHCCTLSLISSGELLNTFPIDLESHSRYAIFH